MKINRSLFISIVGVFFISYAQQATSPGSEIGDADNKWELGSEKE